jgi:thiol-disulfide isomerase/thioredoxin
MDSIANELKKFCKNDDTCLFVILVLFGFLLCMFFNRNEGFLDFSFLDGQGEKHSYDNPENQGDIGKKPEKIGVQLNPNKPINGYGPLEGKVNVARTGKQYQMGGFVQQGGIHTSDSSFPMGYDFGASGGYYFLNQDSSFGRDRPMDKEIKQVAPVQKVMPQNIQQVPEKSTVSGSSSKELELVLFYAPWCGHSKNMLGDYDSVMNQYSGGMMNDVKLKISKIDMDVNPNAAKEYDVEVKGFPTLYTFTSVNGRKVGQLFNPRKQDEIVAELEKRTSSL